MSSPDHRWNQHVVQLIEEGYEAEEATLEAMRRFPSDYVTMMAQAGMKNDAIVARLAGVSACSPPFRVRTKK